ncbi:predicted protein [Chaetomium globosum CBS 148.51]|uniref:Uncharacterized protein n=1 Tax=Chaetomium globosum (strain ATCC 6205 / CBS 148.51 / DSM 1962 / NBRC 6347 / NRRL 1970) TaxID=306901 RepID=Q2HA37_CHAGB|nr:uncharacterized protein CHGG_02917 [Chaetomium globosum CBS 148.51]EAQ90982.1 predicted protein [Chaetomium globosum CBS 148.51]
MIFLRAVTGRQMLLCKCLFAVSGWQSQGARGVGRANDGHVWAYNGEGYWTFGVQGRHRTARRHGRRDHTRVGMFAVRLGQDVEEEGVGPPPVLPPGSAGKRRTIHPAHTDPKGHNRATKPVLEDNPSNNRRRTRGGGVSVTARLLMGLDEADEASHTIAARGPNGPEPNDFLGKMRFERHLHGYKPLESSKATTRLELGAFGQRLTNAWADLHPA